MTEKPTSLFASGKRKILDIIRNSLFFAALATTFVPISNASGAPWVQAAGPYGGEITALARKGDTLFAGSYGNISRSTDHGTTWKKCDSGICYRTWINSFAISGDVILASGDWCGVYRSINNGDSWTNDSNNLSNQIVKCLESNGSIVIAGTKVGLFVSVDKGKTWSNANSGLRDSSILSLAATGSRVFAGTADGIYYSSDTVWHWTKCGSLPQGWVASMAVIGQNIFAACAYGFFHSSDTGITWSEVQLDDPSERIQSITVNGTRVYAGTMSGNIYSSSDSGRSELKIGAGIGIRDNIIQSLQFDGTTLIAGTRVGIYRSSDSGKSWILSSKGITATFVTGFATRGSDLFASTNTSGIFISRDSGLTWNPVAMPLDFLGLSIAAQGTDLYTGSNNTVYHSIDSGKTWSEIDSGLTSRCLYKVAATGAGIFTGGQGIFRLEENSYWVPVNSGLPANPSVSFLTASGNRLYAGLYGEGVFVSDDSGGGWMKIYSCANARCVTQIGSHVFIGTFYNGIPRSPDFGVSWKVDSMAAPPVSDPVESLAAADSDLYTGTPRGVYRSSDYGATWNLAGNDGTFDAYALITMGKYLVAGTGGSGVWRMSLQESNVNKNHLSSQTPPFATIKLVPGTSPKITVNFSLNRPEAVAIRLFDPSGRTVMMLADKTYAAGRHSMILDAGGLSHGCYMARINTSGKSIVKTVLLAR